MTEINWKYELGERIVRKDDNGEVMCDFTITNREIRVRKKKNKSGFYNFNERFYEYKCNLCKTEHEWKNEYVLGTKRCSFCLKCKKKKIRGVNTIGDLYPEYVQYFKGNDAFDPKLKISDRYDLICPICGRTKNMSLALFLSGVFYCDYCHSIANKRPELVNYFVNKNDASVVSCGSKKKVLLKCPDCGNEKYINANSFCERGFHCSKCGDNISFPEKFIICLLNQLNINFTTQLTSAVLHWCENYRYDFYIEDKNMIIETHGMQHYVDKSSASKKWRKLEEEQENDTKKEKLAKENKIENYVILDCRESSIAWIKNSVLSSKLNELYDLSMIDWEQCARFASKNFLKEICNYWNTHNNLTTGELSKIFSFCSGATIRNYLKIGTKLGWCDYSVKNELDKNRERIKQAAIKRSKRVVLIKNGEYVETFESVSQMMQNVLNIYGIALDASHVYNVCCGKLKHHKGFSFKFIDN